jgi:copper chaperone CopZ
MSKAALAGALVAAGFFAALGLHDPLAAATLTSADRAAGLRSTELVVGGQDCRFCRIGIERTLKAVPGVKAAKADMTHHRARVVYDPNLVVPPQLAEAIRESGIGAGAPVPGAPSAQAPTPL